MRPWNPTRRQVAVGLATAAAIGHAAARAGGAGPTAGEVVRRIRERCAREGVAWSEPTVDVFKIGDPGTRVSGVVTTFMGTLALMRAAVAAKANLIVSHEPVFYNHFDRTADLRDDPVYIAKTRFAAENGLVVWRFHDHLHRLRPEPMATAAGDVLGWRPYAAAPTTNGYEQLWTIPETTLASLAAELRAAMPSRSIRVVGDPDLRVRRVVNVGHTVAGVARAWERGDVALAAEVREWESAEYARDAVSLGERKALVMIAHERGEEAGMARAADWIRPLVPEVEVRFLPSGEPYRGLTE